uniref:Uncharacterized protein n=1 Tax=virus sp. ctmTa7 TaxID=2828255 RepID=A0A8S5RCH4_9VIRU|nr:MAG TPA: hypothetical protein [virus sp. ctmTa7]
MLHPLFCLFLIYRPKILLFSIPAIHPFCILTILYTSSNNIIL